MKKIKNEILLKNKNIFKRLSFAVLFLIISAHTIYFIFTKSTSGIWMEDYKSDLFFESLFIIANILCFIGCFLRFENHSFLKIGAVSAVIIKTFHLIIEFCYAGGFYASMMENSPKFDTYILIKFLIVIILYLSIYAGIKTIQVIYKVVLPVFFALVSIYCIQIVLINFLHRNDYQDGYVDFVLNMFFMAGNIVCFVSSLFKYKPRILFKIASLIVAVSKLIHIVLEFVITGGIDMMVGWQSSKRSISALIGLIILSLLYILLFVFTTKKQISNDNIRTVDFENNVG